MRFFLVSFEEENSHKTGALDKSHMQIFCMKKVEEIDELTHVGA